MVNPTQKFKLKTQIIEAIQYSNDMRINDCLPEGVYIVPWDTFEAPGDQPVVHTLEGDKLVKDGDWVVTSERAGVKGEKTVCEPLLFEHLYERG